MSDRFDLRHARYLFMAESDGSGYSYLLSFLRQNDLVRNGKFDVRRARDIDSVARKLGKPLLFNVDYVATKWQVAAKSILELLDIHYGRMKRGEGSWGVIQSPLRLIFVKHDFRPTTDPLCGYVEVIIQKVFPAQNGAFVRRKSWEYVVERPAPNPH